MTSYRIHTTDESHRDNGSVFDTMTEAAQALSAAEGYEVTNSAWTISCDGGTHYFYPSHEACDEDQDGAYAASITREEQS
jgi:hypothetical protein